MDAFRWTVLGLFAALMLVAPLTYCGVQWQRMEFELRTDCQTNGGVWNDRGSAAGICMWSKEVAPS